MKALVDHVGWQVERRMLEAMLKAMALGRHGPPPNFDSVEYAAAWTWLHSFRDAGKTSAYGPAVQSMNADANSHALRGFLIGWAMREAMTDAPAVGAYP